MTMTLLLYCLAVVASSVAGGLIPLLLRLTHTRLQLAISLTAGFMLGVAMLHMVPHAIASEHGHGEAGGLSPASAMLWVTGGFLLMFFIERFFSFHTHEVAELDPQGQVLTSAEDLPEHDHEQHACHHEHAHAHGMVGNTPGNKLSWAGAAVGMSLHSVIGGVALGSAVAAEYAHAAAWPGLAVWLVIVLHKPLDSLTVVTLTASAGYAKATRHLINALFSLAVPVGVVIFLLGLRTIEGEVSVPIVAVSLAFSAGTFLCIALSDLLPELHFHAHDRVKLSLTLLLGVGLAIAVASAESAIHDHGHDHEQEHVGHDHAGHQDHAGHAGHAEHGESDDLAVPVDAGDHDHGNPGDHAGHDH